MDKRRALLRRNSIEHHMSAQAVVFVDVRMPQMDGFDTVEALTKTVQWGADKPTVCVVSSATNTSDQQRAEDLPVVENLTRKPLSADTLAAMVEQAVS